ncbi:hypothetical protein [Erythrobacter sp. YT30]|uniref:hypothetical protein n=1 Tax=Erythrobacter sp. YT30 TaxID=1735012 RepID=UPI00076CE059|nr:hypothetical protein [Erythrobacter sp. YT30]KWV92885.1 hypothetical protein AUC45_01690 [Erythrobacter sp. YT30]
MSDLEQQFKEDRALRNAALAVLKSDVEHAKTALSGKAVAERVGNRVGDGAKDILEIAKGHADDNRGILAALIGALVLWFAREPLLEILGFGSASDNEVDNTPFEEDEEAASAQKDFATADATGDTVESDETVSEMVNDNE